MTPKNNIIMSQSIQSPRRFEDSFKLEVVQEAISSGHSKYFICKKYGINSGQLYGWIRIFAPEYQLSDLSMKKKPVSENDEILSLRRALQQKELELKKATMRGDFYDEMINVAEGMFNIPIRKKAGTKQ